jgi:Trypsin
LSNPIQFSSIIRPIRLPQPSSEPFGIGTFTGWGNIGVAANILQKAKLTTISNSQCSASVDTLDLNVSLNVTANFCTGPLTGAFSLCNGTCIFSFW